MLNYSYLQLGKFEIGLIGYRLIGYADDSTLMAVVRSPDARVAVAESLNRDLVRVNA